MVCRGYMTFPWLYGSFAWFNGCSSWLYVTACIYDFGALISLFCVVLPFFSNSEITGALTCWVVTLVVLRRVTARYDTLRQCDRLWFQKAKSRKWHKQCTPSRCSFPDFVICNWVILSLSNKDKHIDSLIVAWRDTFVNLNSHITVCCSALQRITV